MAQIVVKATSVNRAVLRKRAANDLNADFDSDIADFLDMKIGSLQVWYKNTDARDGFFEVYVSNFDDAESFGKYPSSLTQMDADCNGLVWAFSALSFRYAFLRYTKGATITQGDVEIVAVGKK